MNKTEHPEHENSFKFLFPPETKTDGFVFQVEPKLKKNTENFDFCWVRYLNRSEERDVTPDYDLTSIDLARRSGWIPCSFPELEESYRVILIALNVRPTSPHIFGVTYPIDIDGGLISWKGLFLCKRPKTHAGNVEIRQRMEIINNVCESIVGNIEYNPRGNMAQSEIFGLGAFSPLELGFECTLPEENTLEYEIYESYKKEAERIHKEEGISAMYKFIVEKIREKKLNKKNVREGDYND